MCVCVCVCIQRIIQIVDFFYTHARRIGLCCTAQPRPLVSRVCRAELFAALSPALSLCRPCGARAPGPAARSLSLASRVSALSSSRLIRHFVVRRLARRSMSRHATDRPHSPRPPAHAAHQTHLTHRSHPPHERSPCSVQRLSPQARTASNTRDAARGRRPQGSHISRLSSPYILLSLGWFRPSPRLFTRERSETEILCPSPSISSSSSAARS